MNSSSLLLIRADASREIGTGHVMRCFALAQAWQRSGGHVSFAMAEEISALSDRLRAQGIGITSISAKPGTEEDMQQTCDLATQWKSAWCVVDSYRSGPFYQRTLKKAGLRVMVLDDDGRFPEYCANVVVNQNLGAAEMLYPKCDRDTRLLLGTQYALLRPEFLSQPRCGRETPARAKNILLTMGGSDADNVTAKVMRALASLDGEFHVTTVVGSGNPHAWELIRHAESAASGIQVEKDPSNMARLMADCDMAVSAAGSTCWELAYMGLPMILVVLSQDQQEIARALDARGVATSLGWHANLTPHALISTVRTLADDAAKRRAMSAAGQMLVDGKGAERVVEFLRNSP